MAKFEWMETPPRDKLRYRYKYRESNGGFQVSSILYGPVGTEGRHKRINKAFADRDTMLREMERYIDKLHSKACKAPPSDEGERPLRYFADRRFNALAVISGWDTGKNGTRYQYRTALYNRLIPRFGDKPLASITLADCEQVLDQCVRRDNAEPEADAASEDYRAWLQNVLQHVFRYAKAVGAISQNPLAGIKPADMSAPLIRRVTERRLRPKSIPMDRLRKALELVETHVEDKSEYIIFALMACLGCRDSAAAGLRFCDVIEDKTRGVASARVAMQSDAERRIKAGLKTEASHRMIPILPELRRIIYKRYAYLRRSYPHIPKDELKLWTIACKDNDPAQPCNLHDIISATEPFFKAAGIDKENLLPLSESMKAEEIDERMESPTAYAFRRNFSSLLFDVAGLADDEAMYLMGHSQRQSSEKRNRKYAGAEMQYGMYEKMLRISCLLHEQEEAHAFRLDAQCRDVKKADVAKVSLDVLLEAGESIDVMLSGLAPHDGMEIKVQGPAPLSIRAAAHTDMGKHPENGTNLLGDTRAMTLCNRREPVHAAKKPAARAAAAPCEDVPGWNILYDGWDGEIPAWLEQQNAEWDWDAFLQEQEEAIEAVLRQSPWGYPYPKKTRKAGPGQSSTGAESPAPKKEGSKRSSPKAAIQAADAEKNKMLVLLTARGYMVRIGKGLFAQANVNTLGTKVMDAQRLGEAVTMLLLDQEEHILGISDTGCLHVIRCENIPCADNLEILCGKDAPGFCMPAQDGQRMTHLLHMPAAAVPEQFLVLATNTGRIAKRSCSSIAALSKKEGQSPVVRLYEGESVVGSAWCGEDEDVLLFSAGSHVLPCRVRDIRSTQSVAYGITGIGLKDEESDACMGIAPPCTMLASFSDGGRGKISETKQYYPFDDPAQTMGRGSLGKQANKLGVGQKLAVCIPKGASDYLYMLSTDGRVLLLPASALPVSGRTASGSYLMDVRSGVRLCCVVWG